MKSRLSFNSEKIISYGIQAATMLAMLWVVRSVFSVRGYLDNWDAEFYSLSGQYWVRHLLPHGNLSGWFPMWLEGFDYYIMYPPMTAYVLGFMSLLAGPIMPARIFSVVIWLAFIPVMYNFLRSLGSSRLISAIGASLMITLDATLSAGYSAIFMIGFLPQGFGFVWCIGALGRMYRDLTSDHFDLRRSIVTGAIIGGLVLTHHFCTLWYGIVSTLLLLVVCVGTPSWREKVKSYITAFSVGLALSAFWWLPLLMNRKMMVEVPPVFSPLSAVEQWANIYRHFSPLLYLLTLIGGGYLYLNRQRRLLVFILLMGTFSVLQSFGMIPFPFEIISPIQARRFQAYTEWTMLVLVAFSFRWFQDVYEKNIDSRIWRLIPNLLLLVFIHFQLRNQTFLRFLDNPPIIDSTATRQMDALAEQLKMRIKPGEMHMSEASNFPQADERYPSPHFVHENLVRLVPGLWDIAGGYPESVWGAKEPFWLTRLMRTKIAASEQFVRRQGVRYVTTMLWITDRTVRELPWLRKIWSADTNEPKLDNLTLYEVVDFNTPFGLTPALGKEMKSLTFDAPGRYRLTFNEPVPLPKGTAFAVNYHPWLQLFVDGHRVPSMFNDDKKIAIGEDVPQGSEVEIRYVWPLLVSFVRIFSLGCWLLFAVFCLRGRRFSMRGSAV